MRRALKIISGLLILAGLELAASTLSYTLFRLEETFRIAFAGESLVIPLPAFLVGCVLIGIGLVFWLLAVWADSRSKLIQPGVGCLRCGGETKRLKRKLHHKLLAALVGHRVTHRHCGKCGWGGLSLKN